jgi:hypothetical protein
MRFLRPLLVASSLSLFASSLLACGGPSEPVTPAAPDAAPPPAPVATGTGTGAGRKDVGEPADEPAKVDAAPAPKPLEAMLPTVKVLEAGTAPKKALRYKFKAGTTEYVEMDMKMSMAMSMGGRGAPKVDLPTVRTTMRIDAKELTPEGDLRCTFNADKVEVLKDVQVDPKMRGTLEKDLAGLVGMHGKARISTRGVASETELELSPGAPPSLRGQLDTMRDAIRNMYVPFPEEEVGKGAKWEVTSRVPLSGAMMDTKMLYTLTKLEAESAQTDVEVALSAPPNQAMQIAALPPNASATLDSLSGKGSGKVSPSFVRLVGTGTNKLAMEAAFGVAMQGEKVQMKMQSDVVVALRPAKAPGPPAPPKK